MGAALVSLQVRVSRRSSLCSGVPVSGMLPSPLPPMLENVLRAHACEGIPLWMTRIRFGGDDFVSEPPFNADTGDYNHLSFG